MKVGPYLFFTVNRQLSSQVRGADLIATASYPQIDKPADAAERSWNAAHVITPAIASPCDNGAGKVVDQSTVNFATAGLINVTKDSYFYCPDTPHGYDNLEQETVVLRPDPHLLVTTDIFMSNTPWKKYLADTVASQVSLTKGDEFHLKYVRSSAIDPKHWIFGRDGLTVSFEPYELGMGRNFAPQILISWNTLKQYLNPTIGLPS